MKFLVILVNVCIAVLGIFSVPGAFTAPMMFDAPGSDKNPFIWLSALSAMVLPLTILVSEIISWIRFFHGDISGALLWGLGPVAVNFGLILLGFLLARKRK